MLVHYDDAPKVGDKAGTTVIMVRDQGQGSGLGIRVRD